jgi:hypothetical protein
MILLSRRVVISILGADSANFLQGLISNDIAKASDGLMYAFFLNPQGRFLADFFILKTETGYLIDIPLENADAIIAKLKMYKLRCDVAIEDLRSKMVVCVSKTEGLADPRSAALWRRGFYNASSDILQDLLEYEAQRISLLIADGGQDFIYDKSFPLEFRGEELNGVDFRKGCYVGQEVVARIKNKSVLRKRIYKVRGIALPAKGAELICDGKNIGVMLGSAENVGLALLNIELVDSGLTMLQTNDGNIVELSDA